jgi:hypothetical protein
VRLVIQTVAAAPTGASESSLAALGIPSKTAKPKSARIGSNG